ncbi:hypothetical protein PTTG_25835 [Puccinia triticina 1-1 BBBD Race 1]|uniref:Proteasome assembly chaperone 4 n=2 Tax=Puccinia triticina TaxID=208348 RepID=A0A180H010_PUCT1|nr:hypothetical protein PTTG_25835 [Puccinia triticina 1-1 BBBD Race 1]
MERSLPSAAAGMISVEAHQTKLNVPDRPGLPDFLFHFTRLTRSMLVWIGTVPSDHSGCNPSSAVDTCLAKDWSCAVPPSSSFPAIATQLNSSNPTDAFSQALAQKIAQKFKIQAFVSIDLPASILGSDAQIKFELEKQLFAHIQSLLSTKT